MINHKSLHDDIWQDVIDYKNGTTLRMFIGDNIYTGILVGHEEKGSESWFVLEDYIVESSDGTYNSENIKIPHRIAINMKNIDRIELFYGNKTESKIIIFFKNLWIKLFYSNIKNDKEKDGE